VLTFAPQAMRLSLRPGRNLVVAGAATVLTLAAAVVLMHRSPARRAVSPGTAAMPVPRPQAGPAGLSAPHETSRTAPVIEPVLPDTVPPPRAAQAERVAPVSAAPEVHKRVGTGHRATAHPATAHRRRYAKREKRIARQTQVAVRAARTPAPAGDPRATYERGNALLFSGDAAGAVAAYREAVQLAPADPIGYRGLGLAYEQLGQTAAASRALRRYLKLAPGAADRAIISRRIERLGQTASHK
jgi:tetratricopeptide (TPR) repeat protein